MSEEEEYFISYNHTEHSNFSTGRLTNDRIGNINEEINVSRLINVLYNKSYYWLE
jgi:hypothetical protein